MIRNVVTVKIRDDADRGAVDDLVAEFRRLQTPGMRAYTVGLDLGLREGNWSMAIVGDFDDIEAYRAYDTDAEHNRLRGEVGRLAEAISRVQFEMPG